jgi:hypothetical protein
MRDQPAKQKPANIRDGEVKQVGVSSTNEGHDAYLPDMNFISLRLFA